MTSYLIIATYDHDAYTAFKDAEPSSTGRADARKVAVDLFGDRDGRYGTGGLDVTQESAPPPKPKWTEFFTFAAAFPYLKIEDTDPLKEDKSRDYLFGWVGIVPDEGKLTSLKAFIGWPGGPFCKVFDIQINEIRLVEETEPGSLDTALQNKSKDETVWEERGFVVYEEQTPAMWNFPNTG